MGCSQVMLDRTKFEDFCAQVVEALNRYAAVNPEEVKELSGVKLETLVYEQACLVAKGTEFEGQIEKKGGQKFPDILVTERFGIEVKSSKSGWTVPGGSVMEGTRIETVEAIQVIFGNLSTLSFLNRPYEKCLFDVVVTHSPRYFIDMNVTDENTIFHKVGLDYETIRKSENPVKPFLDYKKNENPNANFWWAQDKLNTPDASIEESIAPVELKFWRDLEPDLRKQFVVEMICLYPQIFSSDPKKYREPALYLIREKGVILTNIRDPFSAGGVVSVSLGSSKIDVSHIVSLVHTYKKEIKSFLNKYDSAKLTGIWGIEFDDPVSGWISRCRDVASKTTASGLDQILNLF